MARDAGVPRPWRGCAGCAAGQAAGMVGLPLCAAAVDRFRPPCNAARPCRLQRISTLLVSACGRSVVPTAWMLVCWAGSVCERHRGPDRLQGLI